jgi:hypothetical integral membrane protein (TIGR02206 family)
MRHLPARAEQFVAFSGQHWLLLGVFVVGVVLLPTWGRAHRDTPEELAFRRVFAVVLGAAFVGMQVYYQLEPGPFELGSALPLELCDLAAVAAVVALLTRNEVATAFAYYVALTLSVQGILTPALTQPFPSLRFLGFWALHLMVVWAAAYLTWGLGFRPTWRLYAIVCSLTVAWAVAAYGLNVLLGTNYGYLNGKPASASLLDLLGPWPVYLVASVAVVAAGWALVLTLPWELLRARSRRR